MKLKRKTVRYITCLLLRYIRLSFIRLFIHSSGGEFDIVGDIHIDKIRVCNHGYDTGTSIRFIRAEPKHDSMLLREDLAALAPTAWGTKLTGFFVQLLTGIIQYWNHIFKTVHTFSETEVYAKQTVNNF